MTAAPAAPAISSTTPILDRLTPAPAPAEGSPQDRRDITIILWIVCSFMGIGTYALFRVTSGLDVSSGPGYQLRQLLSNAFGKLFPGDLSGYKILLPFLFAVIALFAAVAVHELGHLLAGTLARFRFESVQVGPVQITRPFRVRWRWRRRIVIALGAVVMAPVDARNLRVRAIIMMLGAPAANLFTGLSCAFLWSRHGLFSWWFIVMSVFLGVVNLLPFTGAGIISDGKRILMLLRNSRQGQRWLALLRLVTDMQSGVDFEKFNPELIRIATAIEDQSPDTVTAHYVAYWTALRKHDDSEAARLLEACLRHSDRVPPRMREAVFTDAAVFQARRRKRVDLAQQWLTEIAEKPVFPQHRLQAQASILEAQGDVPAAIKKLDECEALALNLVDPSQKETSLRYLQRWRAELQRQLELKTENSQSSDT